MCVSRDYRVMKNKKKVKDYRVMKNKKGERGNERGKKRKMRERKRKRERERDIGIGVRIIRGKKLVEGRRERIGLGGFL